MSILTKTINEYVKEAHDNAVKHGWWEKPKSMGELLALIHSEVSEALEEHRNGKTPNETYYSGKVKANDGKVTHIMTSNQVGYAAIGYQPNIHIDITKPEGIPSELADVVIRVFDMCGYFGIDLEDAISEKMEYNKNRPYKHGNKKL